jgi:hypothetical protein
MDVKPLGRCPRRKCLRRSRRSKKGQSIAKLLSARKHDFETSDFVLCDMLLTVNHVMRVPLKLLRCMVWVLGAFLILAAIDKVPDPPAANPNSAWLSALWVHQGPVAVVTPFPMVSKPPHLPVRISVRDEAENCLCKDLTIPLERAADSSPPTLRFRLMGTSPA